MNHTIRLTSSCIFSIQMTKYENIVFSIINPSIPQLQLKLCYYLVTIFLNTVAFILTVQCALVHTFIVAQLLKFNLKWLENTVGKY